MRRVSVFALLSFVLFLSAAASSLKADVQTDGISYQGLLSDGSGVPVADGPKDLILSVWSDPVGGTMLYSELVNVTTSGGLFSTCLGCGSSTFSQIFEGQSLYLQTQVAGQAPMVPRTLLGNVPSAMTSSSFHGQATQGASASRGIITLKPGTSTSKGRYVLEEDSDGDGVYETVVTDSIEGMEAVTLIGHDFDEDGDFDVMAYTGLKPTRVELGGKFSDGDTPVEGQRLTILDSTGVSTVDVVDLDGDGKIDGRVRQLMTTPSPGHDPLNMVIGGEMDSDDDGQSDLIVEQHISPTTCGVAINTKGTGADKGRIIMTSDPDSDGDAESTIDQAITPTTCGVAIKTKGTGADKGRVILTSDPNSDDDPESSIEQAITPTTCGVAIQTKGTGADKNRVIQTSDPDSDGDAESTIDQAITPTTCGVAIKTKGTGADKGRIIMTSDPDSDGDDESTIDQFITPTTCGVAINTKGTGADKNRIIMTSDPDSDGDAESTIDQSITPTTCGVAINTKGTGADKGRVLISTDTDEDNDSEGEVELSVTPGTCGVAIQTKGTGADKNRVIGTTDDTTASMVMATDSATIAMKVRHGGTVKGGITISSGAGLRQVDMGSDGNAFFATGVGVGVDPTHPVEVAGGAYCDGANWVNASDVNSKENFEPVNGEELLAKLAGLEITKWNYKGDLKSEHIGPTAQGFKEAFGVGSDGKSISTIDPSGIALAAIQELSRQNQEVRQENAALKAQLEELARRMDKMAASR